MKNLALVAVLLVAVAACEEPQKSDETTQEPAEKPAVEKPVDETTREPAEQPAEHPADMGPAENESAPAEEPVEGALEEGVIAPPTVSQDAPSEPHMGEPPSATQPHPVYPEGEPGTAAEPHRKLGADKPAGGRAVEETISEDTPAGPHMGEPPSSAQPQPVYPEGEPGAAAEPKARMETDKPARERTVEEDVIAPPTASEVAPSQPHMGELPSPSQPQPVYPEGEPGSAAEPKARMETHKPAGKNAVEEELIAPPTASENGLSEPHIGEQPSPSQPQPIYPEGKPVAATEPKAGMETDEPTGEKAVQEELIAPPTATEDGSSEATMGEPPFPSQPQPVYPEDKPGDAAQP